LLCSADQTSGKCNVPPLLNVKYLEDQFSLILPYFDHEPFKYYFSTMDAQSVREYMKNLFVSLEHIHKHNVIHRDVKPTNFLHHRQKREYLLVDFGLAEDAVVTRRSTMHSTAHSTRSGVASPASKMLVAQRGLKRSLEKKSNLQRQAAIKMNDINRAGTRGFRAPEVLMRSLKQTVALDIWSAGVILLSILSGRYPFFQAPDDMTALAELACLFGSRPLMALADSVGRVLELPEEKEPLVLKDVCLQLRRNISPEMPDSVWHLLTRCLTLDPGQRITASEALLHPFIKQN
jgi:cell division control protein 7